MLARGAFDFHEIAGATIFRPKIGRLDGRSARVRTIIIGRTERVGSTLKISGVSDAMALPLPFLLPFSKLRIRGIPRVIALPLLFPLPFPVLGIIGVAFPLPFQNLLALPFPIFRITGVLFSLPFQHLFPVLRISGVAFPPPFPQRCPPPFSVLRVRGIAFPHSFPVLLDRFTPAWRHIQSLRGNASRPHRQILCHVTDFVKTWNRSRYGSRNSPRIRQQRCPFEQEAASARP